MTRFILTTAAAAILSSTAAFAATDLSDFDNNGDGFASVAEVSATLPGFTASDFRGLDSNRDNRLSATELQTPGVHSILGRYQPVGASFTDLATIDVDGNGFASFDELVAAYPGLTSNDWRSIDTNRDNRVSAPELSAEVAQFAVSRSVASVESLVGVSQLDTNGDNFVQFDELTAVYPGLSALDFDAIDTNDDRRVSFNELYDLDSQVLLSRAGS